MSAKKHTPAHYLLTAIVKLFQSLIGAVAWVVIGAIGYFFLKMNQSPVNLIIGLPMLLIGVGGVVNSAWSVVISIFSSHYNKGVCIFCDR